MRKNIIYLGAFGVVGWWFYESLKSNDVSDGEEDFLSKVTSPFLGVGYKVANNLGMGLGMQISLAGLNHIKDFEKFRALPYDDGYGFMTIGYGHKILPLESFKSITMEEALRILASDVSIAESAVNSLVTVKLTQNQYDALVSFVFNVGVGGFKRSTLLKKINANDFAGALKEFPKWRMSAGRVSAGLSNRRASEAGIFSGGRYA